MKLNQQNLVAVHEYIANVVQQWASGLITNDELAHTMARVSERFKARESELSGLVDPNTGLRYGAGTWQGAQNDVIPS